MICEIVEAVKDHSWGPGSEWFWAFLSFLVLLATFIVIFWQLRIQTKSHIVQSICTIQEHWNSESMQRIRLSVCTRWKKDQKDFDGASDYVASFFEDLGVFVKIGAIPKKIMWDVQSWNIEHYWFMFQKGIKEMRNDCQENVYCDFEKLFKDMREISDAKNLPSVDAESIDKFVKREIRATKTCLDIKQRPASYYESSD